MAGEQRLVLALAHGARAKAGLERGGDAANLVLLSEDEIEAAALALCSGVALEQ